MLESAPNVTGALAGRRILIVEDEFLAADEIAQTLQARGADIVGAVSTVKKALAFLKTSPRIDAAVVDINLAGEMAYPVVEALVALNKPVIFATTFHSYQLPEQYRSVPRCSKPMQPQVLLRELARVFEQALPGANLDSDAPPRREPTSVFLVDDADGLSDAVSRRLRGQRLDIERFRNADEFLKTDHPERTGCVLLMASANEATALRLLDQLRVAAHRLPVVVIAKQVDLRFAVGAVRSGAYDVLNMSVEEDLLLDSLQEALNKRDRAAMSQPSAASKAAHDAAAALVSTLSIRQAEILDLIMQGHPNKNIAADLGISQRTAENHRAAIMRKLRASSISALVQLVVAAGGPWGERN